MQPINIPAELTEMISAEAEKAGYTLVDVFTNGRKKVFIEIVIDGKNGVTVEQCSGFNRHIAALIEEKKILAYECTIEVSSPGLDRTLKSAGDFSWAAGKQVEVIVREPVEGKIAVLGRLLSGNNEEGITVEVPGGDAVKIDGKNIVKAKLKPVISYKKRCENDNRDNGEMT